MSFGSGLFSNRCDGGIHTFGGHFAGFGGDNALPAQKRRLADELQRVEGHFDGEPVGAPADEGGDHGDAEVLPKFRIGK